MRPQIRQALAATRACRCTMLPICPSAVLLASAQAQPGDAVLLSPACASMDMFRDYAHRAQVFIEAVQALAAGRRASAGGGHNGHGVRRPTRPSSPLRWQRAALAACSAGCTARRTSRSDVAARARGRYRVPQQSRAADARWAWTRRCFGW